MKRLISTLNLSKEDWLRYRKCGITGTDAGAILGLNPYRSAFQIYHDKISDTTENIDNEAMRQGRDLEDYYAQLGERLRMLSLYFCRTVRVDCPVFIWRHTMKEEKIKVLALLPMELPKEIDLDNTLEAMQKFVGGLIECITLSDTGSAVTLVCNDEGKLLGLPLNRPLWDGADVLAGPGFLAGCDNEGNLTSLPQSAMDFYKEKFRAFIIEI